MAAQIRSDSTLNSDQVFNRDMERLMDTEFASVDGENAAPGEVDSDTIVVRHPTRADKGSIAENQDSDNIVVRPPKTSHTLQQRPLRQSQRFTPNLVSGSALRERYWSVARSHKQSKPAQRDSPVRSITSRKRSLTPSPKAKMSSRRRHSQAKQSEAQQPTSSLLLARRNWRSAFQVVKRHCGRAQKHVERLKTQVASLTKRAERAERVGKRLRSALVDALQTGSDDSKGSGSGEAEVCYKSEVG